MASKQRTLTAAEINAQIPAARAHDAGERRAGRRIVGAVEGLLGPPAPLPEPEARRPAPIGAVEELLVHEHVGVRRIGHGDELGLLPDLQDEGGDRLLGVDQEQGAPEPPSVFATETGVPLSSRTG